LQFLLQNHPAGPLAVRLKKYFDSLRRRQNPSGLPAKKQSVTKSLMHSASGLELWLSRHLWPRIAPHLGLVVSA
ncbi:MAG: hypothetical protein ACRED3_04705, partial [Bradyrhizobium sp.]